MSLHPAMEQADSLIELRRYDQARALLARRLAEDPDDVRAWVQLGRCHLGAKDPRQALDAFDEALTRDPENIGALVLRARALRSADQPSFAERWHQAETALRTALRVAPRSSGVHAALGELLSYLPDRRSEAIEAAREAVRLDPESVPAYEALWMAAGAANDVETYRWALRQVLRLDPTNGRALLLVSDQQAHQPGTGPGQAAEVYADALAVNPDSPGLRQGLDRATYRLLRGTRWLALICLAAAGATIDLFPVDGEPGRDLPVPLGNRLWTLALMAAVWGFGAWRRYRRLRTGVQLNVRSLVRTHRWAQIVLAQAGVAMLCALLISQAPWSARTLPQVLFWVGLVPTLATVWFDRNRTG